MSKGNNNTKVDRNSKIGQPDNTPLEPMNSKQHDYIQAIKQNSVVVCLGVWGSSKTFIPSVIAAEMILTKQIKKIIIARPAEGKGKSIGFLKGDAKEKLEPWCQPVTDTLRKRLGATKYEYLLGNNQIEMLALEHVKGRSWDDCFIIVDEAEDIEVDVVKSLVGRQGIRSKTIITGDIRQQDLKRSSGLEYLRDVINNQGLPVPVIDFDSWEYCVRSEEALMWGKAFENFDNAA